MRSVGDACLAEPPAWGRVRAATQKSVGTPVEASLRNNAGEAPGVRMSMLSKKYDVGRVQPGDT